METITRQQLLAGLTTVKTIQSITWNRRRDKVVQRCVTCDRETAIHQGDRFCNHCNESVATYPSTEADKGDKVQMQFIPRINPNGTKNWTPAGGFIFNAPTLEEAKRILAENRLFQCLKMGEQMPALTKANEVVKMIATGDLKALPRCFSIDDVETWTAEGITYKVE